MSSALNFHHLEYFWAVASDGNLTRTARRLRVSQSALSAQIRLLERQLGEDLFARVGRGLVLTEAGEVVLGHANEIFAAGDELVSTLRSRRRRADTLRIGAAATLSRNFQESFLRPALSATSDVKLNVSSGATQDLLERVERRELDVLLMNRPLQGDGRGRLTSRLVAKQRVSIVGPSSTEASPFPRGVNGLRLIVPNSETQIRAEFDALCARRRVRYTLVAGTDVVPRPPRSPHSRDPRYSTSYPQAGSARPAQLADAEPGLPSEQGTQRDAVLVADAVRDLVDPAVCRLELMPRVVDTESCTNVSGDRPSARCTRRSSVRSLAPTARAARASEKSTRCFRAQASNFSASVSECARYPAPRTRSARAGDIVDAFATDEDRGKHLGGDIAKALMAKAGELLSEPPKIEKADVLATKVIAS